MDEVAAEVFDLDQSSIRLVESLPVAHDTIDKIGRLLLDRATSEVRGDRLLIDTMTRALVLHLLRDYSTSSPRCPGMPGKPIDWQLRRAVECMHANLAEGLPLARLAVTVGLGPMQFSRAFRAATGEPPHRFLLGLRIEQAKHLLAHTELSMIDIGLRRCGFGQPSHFATMFRKRMG